MPEGSPGTGFDIRRLFSPGSQAREGREDPRTEPHVPAHAAPENPTPITLEDMSDQGGVGSVSKAEATLTHPSARDMSRTLVRAACPPTLSVSPLWYVSRYSPCVWFDESVVELRVACIMGHHQRRPQFVGLV